MGCPAISNVHHGSSFPSYQVNNQFSINRKLRWSLLILFIFLGSAVMFTFSPRILFSSQTSPVSAAWIHEASCQIASTECSLEWRRILYSEDEKIFLAHGYEFIKCGTNHKHPAGSRRCRSHARHDICDMENQCRYWDWFPTTEYCSC